MKTVTYWFALLVIVSGAVSLNQLRAGSPEHLFDGATLNGWKGDSRWWRVEDGAIVGSNRGQPLPNNTCLIWEGDPVRDFKLTFQAKLDAPNNVSVVLYRGSVTDADEFRCSGYRFTIESAAGYIGMLSDEASVRGSIAHRGERVRVDRETGKPVVIGRTTPLKPIHVGKWHTYSIEARGSHIVHSIDGEVTVDVVDNHVDAHTAGTLALQIHVRDDMTVHYKDLVLQRLDEAP